MNATKNLYLAIFVIFYLGCSKVPIVKDANLGEIFNPEIDADEIVGKAVPKWFIGDRKFLLEQASGEQAVHMFYDMDPGVDLRRKTVNFVAVTPQSSEIQYRLDPLSGQHYSNRSYCKQEDVWKMYKEMIYKPPYTIGIVPRVLDESGQQQKIIVFGDEDYISDNFLTNVFDARIIGGVMERFCPNGACFKLKDWRRRLVLVGVQRDYSKFDNVLNMEQLKKKIDWKETKSFFENGQGHNKVANRYYPSFRMGLELPADKAMEYMAKNSITLRDRKLGGIRNSCHKLYQKIWETVGKDSNYEKTLKTLKSEKERSAYIKKNKITKKSLFHYRFKDAFVNYNSAYKTCLKYIYPSNINYSTEQHWFLTYYSAVHHLHDLGYSFDCIRGVWIKNPVLSSGKKFISLKNEFKSCNAKKVDSAIEKSTNFLKNLWKKKRKTFRYVDYDKGSLGTHKKLYSWVPVSNKHFQCDSRSTPDITKRFNVFPEDVSWRRRRMKMTTDGRFVK